MHTLILTLRFLLREWRSGELRIISTALIIAVSGSSAINFFADRLQHGMLSQASEFIGADLVLSSPHPIDDTWLSKAQKAKLKHSHTIEFTNAVLANNEFALASIKLVDHNYPLKGHLETSTKSFQAGIKTKEIPQLGECWIENRLFSILKISFGDSILASGISCKVTRILTFEPDRGGSLFGFAPRIMLPISSIEANDTIQSGSRINYRYLFVGQDNYIDHYKNWLQPQLEESQKLISIKEGRPEIKSALNRAERYLGLSSLGAILLAGTAIAMGAQRYSQKHYDVNAMLRCFGASQNQILIIYTLQILILGIVASIIGCFIGWLFQEALFYKLKEAMPENLPPPSFEPIVLSFSTGLIILLGFALPPILNLKKVPPLRVLRRDLAPPGSALLPYFSALAAISFLMWKHTGSALLTLIVLGTSVAITILMGFIAYTLLRSAALFNQSVGVAWRFGFKNLTRRPLSSVAQILAFGSTFMAMAMILLVRTDLLDAWQAQLPENAPNHFAFNIPAEDAQYLQQHFQQRAIQATPLFPIVRGRLLQLNDAAIPQSMFDNLGGDGFLKRDLNLTWADTLPEYNHLVQGSWWQKDDAQNSVSVEYILSKRLGVQLGDQLTFVFGREQFSATVSNIRKVEWDSFRPNFYFIFSPSVLMDFPATYVTSFYLATEDKEKFIELIRQFPSTAFIEVEQILTQVKKILAQVSITIEYILAFVLCAGFAVLFAALQATLDERLFEGAMLRALGANKFQLRSGHLAEYAALGFLAGIMAALATEIIAFLLYTQLLHLDYSFKWWIWLITPCASLLLIALVGFWATRKISRQCPLIIFRDL